MSGSTPRSVRLYPRPFREKYGADLAQLLRDQCAEESAWRVYGRALVDVAITVPSQHLEALVHNNSTRVVSLLYAAVATAGALLVIVGGSNAVTLTVGLPIALAAGAMAVVAYKRGAPRGPRRRRHGGSSSSPGSVSSPP